MMQCSAEKFQNWGECPSALEKVGTFEKKWGHCGGNDGKVNGKSKSVYNITDHILTVNKQY